MNIEFSQILFQLINFGVVVGALTFLMFKPIRKMLKDRSDRIEEAQKAAAQTIADHHQIDEMKKKIKRDAEKEASELIEKATHQAEETKRMMIAEAKQHVQAELDRGQKQAEEQKKELLKEFKLSFVDQVIAATEKVIGQTLDQKTVAKQLDADVETLLQHI